MITGYTGPSESKLDHVAIQDQYYTSHVKWLVRSNLNFKALDSEAVLRIISIMQ